MVPREVRTVAICAGSGGSVLDGVDADVYFTGEMAHVRPFGFLCCPCFMHVTWAFVGALWLPFHVILMISSRKNDLADLSLV